VFRDFPKLKLVLSHGGGAIPYQIGRFMAGSYARKGEPFEESIRKLYFDTCLYTREGLELLFKVAGVDRCMFGTEKPGTGTAVHPKTGKYMDDLKPVIESIEWLGQKERKMIFEENAKSVYRLGLK
jgi:4-oxalmesaconate hydratase